MPSLGVVKNTIASVNRSKVDLRAFMEQLYEQARALPFKPIFTTGCLSSESS